MFKNCFIILFYNLLLKSIKGDINEFGLHELDDYNNMIRCLSSFKDDFIECNANIRQLGKTVFNVFPENSTFGKAFKCCGIWMVRDCWYKKAVEKCPKEHISLIHTMPYKLLPMLNKWCLHYREDSFVCRFAPYWPVIPVLLSLLFIIIIILCVICFVRRRRRTKSKDIEALSSDENKKSLNNNTIETDSDE